MSDSARGGVDEVLLGLNHKPITVLVALKEEKIIGFSAYDVTAPGFFGPMGVDEAFRGRGIGKALLFEALDGLRELGYVYGIIGDPGPVDFYLKAIKGLLLPPDWRSIYT